MIVQCIIDAGPFLIVLAFSCITFALIFVLLGQKLEKRYSNELPGSEEEADELDLDYYEQFWQSWLMLIGSFGPI